MESSNSGDEAKPITILGYPVYIPAGRTPFPAQLAVMSKVILAAKDAKNALLESPTGTGKTLAFLCSSLAFQNGNVGKDSSKSNGATDHEANISVPRRGIISEQSIRVFYCTRTHSQLQQIVDELKKCHPLYLKSIKMSLLASRTHYCINDEIKTQALKPGANLDDLCRDAVKFGNCAFRENHKTLLQAVEILQHRQVYDIEDAIGIGEHMTACPYYMNRTISENATYFLSPYNYIIDPHIRSLLRINLNNCIVIFDEAHNIEDVAREAGSFDTSANRLLVSMGNLKSFETVFKELTDSTQILIRFLSRFNAWVKGKVEAIEENSLPTTNNYADGKQKYKMGRSSLQEFVAIGSDAMQEWYNNHGITLDLYQSFSQNLERIVAFIEELQSSGPNGNDSRHSFQPPPSQDVIKLLNSLSQNEKQERLLFLQTGLPKATLEFLRRLSYIFQTLLSHEGKFGPDYRVVIRKQENADDTGNNKYKRRSVSNSQTTLTVGGSIYDAVADQYEINFWCMTGKVVFEPIFQQSRSVMFTSGTLSPMDSFEGEFDVSFPVRVEANHVINLSQQLLVGVIQTYRHTSFLSTYDCQQSEQYLDAVGDAFLEVARRSPGGTLLFVPSYALLARLKHRWTQTRCMEKGSSINSCFFEATGDNDVHRKRINVYFEPKKNEEMNVMLDLYYNDLSVVDSQAAMVAVCRGKVSEGINFSDHYARTVMVLGIPFPSIGDLKVQLKMQYQDMKYNQRVTELNDQYFQQKQQQQQSFSNNDNSSSNSNTSTTGNIRENVTGRIWYKQQALRAVNQAIGRCIRHIQDFGCIVLLDPRFGQEDITMSLSRWMRSEVRVYEDLEEFLPRIDDFFHPTSASSSSIKEENANKPHKPFQKPNSYHNIDKLNQERQEKLKRRHERQLRKQEKKGNSIYEPDSSSYPNHNVSHIPPYKVKRQRKSKESVKLEYEEQQSPMSNQSNYQDILPQSTTAMFPIFRTPAKPPLNSTSETAAPRDDTAGSVQPSSEKKKKRFSFASALEKSCEVVQARSPQASLPTQMDSSSTSTSEEAIKRGNVASSTAFEAGKRVIPRSLLPTTARFTENANSSDQRDEEEEDDDDEDGYSGITGELSEDGGEDDDNGDEESESLSRGSLDEIRPFDNNDDDDEDSLDLTQVFLPNSSIFPTFPHPPPSTIPHDDAFASSVSLPAHVFIVIQQWHLLPCPHFDFRHDHRDAHVSTLASNAFAWLLPSRLTHLHRLFSSSVHVECVAEAQIGQRHVRPIRTSSSSLPRQHSAEGLFTGRLADMSLTTLLAPHVALPTDPWRIVEEWVAEDGVVYRFVLYHEDANNRNSNLSTAVEASKQPYLIAAELAATSGDTKDLQDQIFVHPQVMWALLKRGRFSVAAVREVTNTNESMFV